MAGVLYDRKEALDKSVARVFGEKLSIEVRKRRQEVGELADKDMEAIAGSLREYYTHAVPWTMLAGCLGWSDYFPTWLQRCLPWRALWPGQLVANPRVKAAVACLSSMTYALVAHDTFRPHASYLAAQAMLRHDSWMGHTALKTMHTIDPTSPILASLPGTHSWVLTGEPPPEFPSGGSAGKGRAAASRPPADAGLPRDASAGQEGAAPRGHGGQQTAGPHDAVRANRGAREPMPAASEGVAAEPAVRRRWQARRGEQDRGAHSPGDAADVVEAALPPDPGEPVWRDLFPDNVPHTNEQWTAVHEAAASTVPRRQRRAHPAEGELDDGSRSWEGRPPQAQGSRRGFGGSREAGVAMDGRVARGSMLESEDRPDSGSRDGGSRAEAPPVPTWRGSSATSHSMQGERP